MTAFVIGSEYITFLCMMGNNTIYREWILRFITGRHLHLLKEGNSMQQAEESYNIYLYELMLLFWKQDIIPVVY